MKVIYKLKEGWLELVLTSLLYLRKNRKYWLTSDRQNKHIKVSSITPKSSEKKKKRYNLQTSKGEKWNKKN